MSIRIIFAAHDFTGKTVRYATAEAANTTASRRSRGVRQLPCNSRANARVDYFAACDFNGTAVRNATADSGGTTALQRTQR